MVSNFFAKLKIYVQAHKIISAVVVVIIALGGYYAVKGSSSTTSVTKYVVENATTGSVVASVSGTGQVQAGTTINVSPKVSETVTRVAVKVGDHVAAGQLLVQLDATNEERSVQQAQLSLESAQLAMQELQQVATTSLLQDQNSLTNAQVSVANASTSLTQAYQNGFDTLSSSFTDLQTVINGLQSFAQGNDLSKVQEDPDSFINVLPSYLQASAQPYKNNFETEYTAAVAAYQKNLLDYHSVNRTSDQASLDAVFAETYATAQTISNSVKSGKDFITYIINSYPVTSSTAALPSIVTTFQNNFSTYSNTINNDATSLNNITATITSDRNNIISAASSLAQASETLSELTSGPTQTQLLSQQINLQSAQNSLQTAQENLGYTSVRAPIAGVVSAISATVGETAGSNAVTIVGDGEVAQLTLNEVDASKVVTGDKATLTFDALPDLSLAGTVVEIDPVGTVSQGVVSYNVQISFSQPADTSSTNLVRPGMSADANIVTQADQNVITVPNAAITTVGSSSYILEPGTQLTAAELASSASGGIELTSTQRVPVTIGLSNETVTEVTSGINVGDQIIVQTIKSTTATKSTASTGSTSALQLLSGSGATRTGAAAGGGGFTRGATTGR